MKQSCGNCGHYVRLVGAAHSHRCALTTAEVWPEKSACPSWTKADAVRLEVKPHVRAVARACRAESKR